MKKFLLVLCTITCIFAMTACGAKNESGQSSNPIIEEQDFINNATQRINQYAELTEENLNTMLNGYDKNTKSLAESWKNVLDEAGAFVGIKADAVVTQEADHTAILTMTTEFEKRDVLYSLNVGLSEDGAQLVITGEKFDPIYTTAENLEKAAVNTLIGMGTVFIVLILMIVVISCLKFVPLLQEKFSGKSKMQEPVASVIEEETVVDYEEELADDLELVAVITAAIAATENTSTDGLVVRSIKRAKSAKWQRA